jgi:quercetin dioxygenase-like cupin family protein
MERQTRRVVTGHDETGKAVVLMDSAAPNVRRRNAGLVSTLLWTTRETPVDMSGRDDRAQLTGVAPPPGGSVLRIVDFPPIATVDLSTLDHDAQVKEMGIADFQSPGHARHPFTHRTPTLDYAIVLEGEIDMLLDDSEVHLAAGDIVVQQGTNHAWVNNSDKTCRIAFVLIDAQEPAVWKKG